MGGKKRPAWRYKRHGIPLSKRKTLLGELREKINDPVFSSKFEAGGDKLLKYYFQGIPVMIKNTSGKWVHGIEYEKLRGAFLNHQKAVRSGKIKANNYRIVSPRVFGRIEGFLVMEFMEGRSFREVLARIKKEAWSEGKDAEDHECVKAFQELTENFDDVEYGKFEPDLDDLMVLGKDLRTGKWLFSIPYDFY